MNHCVAFLIGKIESIITPSDTVNDSKMVYGASWKASASSKPCSLKSRLCALSFLTLAALQDAAHQLSLSLPSRAGGSEDNEGAAATLALLHLESKVSLARTLIVKKEEGGKMGN